VLQGTTPHYVATGRKRRHWGSCFSTHQRLVVTGSAGDGEERSAAMKLMDKLLGARRNNMERGKMVWVRMVCSRCLL
jgi:hypothetical protein